MNNTRINGCACAANVVIRENTKYVIEGQLLLYKAYGMARQLNRRYTVIVGHFEIVFK